MLKKFHNIVNSIIILDEVQNIPLKYWPVVREILLALSKYFNCRIILMTATKPLIFENNDFCKELVTNYDQYFKTDELNRVELKYIGENTIDDFYNNLPKLNLNSYLFVFNSISSSLYFYHKIKNIKGYKKFYLSTNIVPKERSLRIKNIKRVITSNKKTSKKKRFIVVSTQMIEAGVDIDCECAYRDIGPFDSIIQVTGRCNRNSLLAKKGIVNIVRLKRQNYRDYCTIYDPVLNDISAKILSPDKIYSESEFLSLIDKYFAEAKTRMYQNYSVINSVMQLNYDDDNSNSKNPISSFRLIENEDYYKRDLYIELDDDAKTIWQQYDGLKKIKDPFDRKNEFLKFRKDFYDYVISVPEKYVNCGEEHPTGIVYVPKDSLEFCYDNETGWKRNMDDGGTYVF